MGFFELGRGAFPTFERPNAKSSICPHLSSDAPAAASDSCLDVVGLHCNAFLLSPRLSLFLP